MSFCNFNSKSDGSQYDFFFHLNTALPFPVQNLVRRLRSQTPSSVSLTPNEVSAIPCELFGNALRALFLKNRDFFWYCEIFLTNTRGSLRCLLGFWPSGPKPCVGNNGSFTESEARARKAIDKCRIHACRESKCKILSFIPSYLRCRADILVQLCCALVNLQFPLIKEVTADTNFD